MEIQYNKMFLTKLYKILLSLNSKTSKHQESLRIFDAINISARSYIRRGRFKCKLAPKLLKHHPDTKYIRKQKCHVL